MYINAICLHVRSHNQQNPTPSTCQNPISVQLGQIRNDEKYGKEVKFLCDIENNILKVFVMYSGETCCTQLMDNYGRIMYPFLQRDRHTMRGFFVLFE